MRLFLILCFSIHLTALLNRKNLQSVRLSTLLRSTLDRSFNANREVQKNSIGVGGVFPSLELYACQANTQNLVISQIANWARAEHFCINDFGDYSLIFASLDGTRVIHSVGWNDNKYIDSVFFDFRKRSDGIDGTPASLKESTHLYKTIFSIPHGASIPFSNLNADNYPYFSFDFFTCKRIESINIISEILIKAVIKLEKNLVEDDVKGFLSMHVLTSTDSLVCSLVSVWSGEKDFLCLQNNAQYRSYVQIIKTFAAEGTLSDYFDKTIPSRVYVLCDIFKPLIEYE